MQFLPRRLNARIILIVSCILLITGAVSGWMTAQDQAENLLTTMRQTSSVIVRNLAESCARFLLVEDYADLETFLANSAELPDIRRLQLCEPDGKLIWDVEHGPDGQARTKTGIARVTPPASIAATTVTEDGVLAIWQPIVAGKVLGWLKAEYSLDGIRAAQARTWRNTLFMTGAWVVCSALLIVLLLRPTVRSIGGLTDYAKRLGEHKGEQIANDGQVLEIAELGASLNETSAKLLAWERQLLAQSESLRRSNRELRALSSCNETLIRAEDEQTLLGDVCRIVCDEAGYRMAWVGYAAHDEAKSVHPVAWAGVEDGYLAQADITWADAERGQGPTGAAIRGGTVVHVENYATDPRAAPWRADALPRGYRSSIALPLRDENANTFGALSIYSQEIDAFKPDEIHLLEGLASDLAFGIVTLRMRAERKRAEAEIRQLNADLERRVAERTAQLEAANKELEAFAYSVSHDLRAPLRHIDGFIHILKEDIDATLAEDQRHYMDTISKAARRMEVLIDDLLSFSRMGRNEMMKTPVALDALVRDVMRELDAQEPGRAVNWRVGELPVVHGDRAMLRLVLINLISNALKFTRRCAQAEIEIGCVPGDAAETVVFVRDNGAGFDMKYVDKLFGVFQRLHGADEFEGTGIGLANVRRVVSRHGGRTWAEGKVDAGATFYFSLPQTCRNTEGA